MSMCVRFVFVGKASEREREREREREIQIDTWRTHIDLDQALFGAINKYTIYIYIYIEREM